MEIEKNHFIEYRGEYDKVLKWDDPAPVFRKHFQVSRKIVRAKLSVCALGIGVLYLNGKRVTEDLFISPVSDYTKTLWYNEYDVSGLLQNGENVFAVMLGNGYYNEGIHTDWRFHEASWRAAEKLLLLLRIDTESGTEYISTDESWLCKKDCSPVRFNQLRFGEYYDANRTTEWMNPELDDSSWGNAASVKVLPKGELRKCTCPPIREMQVFPCKSLFRNQNGDWVFDFGQNMSGYVRLKLDQPKGTVVRVVYAEQLNESGERRENALSRPYADGKTQISRIVCGDTPIAWKPLFSYYGFRYIIVSGLRTVPTADMAEALFVHQDVKRIGSFHCSDETLNKIYDFSVISSLSNMFYMMTDCPTREKLGWCNDAQASAEQLVQNFDLEQFFGKWIQDIWDSQNDAGDMPAIIPTAGWGFHWGNGPTSNGVLFQIADCVYRYYGNREMLVRSLPYMVKYLDFVSTKTDPITGLPAYGLDDWASPGYFSSDKKVPLDFVTSLLMIRCYRIAELSARLAGDPAQLHRLSSAEKDLTDRFVRVYLNADGRCTVDEQTALAMLLVLGIGDDAEPLKKQFAETLRAADYHLNVGMVGMQFVFPACDIIGNPEAGYRLLTASGYPSYRTWFENGATSLYEKWEDEESRNHHMFSCPIAWFHNTVLGIRQTASFCEDKKIKIAPCFLKELTFAEGRYETVCGEISVAWKRLSENTVHLRLKLPQGVCAELSVGDYRFEGTNETGRTVSEGESEFVLIC